MEDVIQMWLESYNTYHLIDGLAMKDAWGCIMPHIILGKKNLQAILDQVIFVQFNCLIVSLFDYFTTSLSKLLQLNAT